MSGNDIEYIYHILNSNIFAFIFKNFYSGGGLGEDAYRYKKIFLEKLPIPRIKIKTDINSNNIEDKILSIIGLNKDELDFIKN